MKLSLDVKEPSSKEWLQAVLADFDTFLQDHASCERKASSMAMSLVSKYPDRTAIIQELIDTALEELEHFKLVYELMRKRGLELKSEMKKDEYVNRLLQQVRTGREERFMDRLLLGSVLEMRGAERFRLIEEALPEGEVKRFYKMLWTSEAKHGNIFVKFALHYFPEKEVYERLEFFMEREAEIIRELPPAPALH